MRREATVQRYIVFTSKRVGKKVRRSVDVSCVYLSEPGRGVDPAFEGRVSKDYVVAFLNSIAAPHRFIGENTVVIESEDPDSYLRRLVVYLGVRQHSADSPDPAEVVRVLSEIEVLFWYSKLLDAYERVGYWGVYRVAKAFRIIHRL